MFIKIINNESCSFVSCDTVLPSRKTILIVLNDDEKDIESLKEKFKDIRSMEIYSEETDIEEENFIFKYDNIYFNKINEDEDGNLTIEIKIASEKEILLKELKQKVLDLETTQKEQDIAISKINKALYGEI